LQWSISSVLLLKGPNQIRNGEWENVNATHDVDEDIYLGSQRQEEYS